MSVVNFNIAVFEFVAIYLSRAEKERDTVTTNRIIVQSDRKQCEYRVQLVLGTISVIARKPR
jgi:hypothetical protein